MPRNRRVPLVIALAMAVLAVAVGHPAAAQGPPDARLQAQIRAHLAAYPGGTQISPTEISYGGGAFVMTFVPSDPAAAGVPDCPSNWFCFYEHVNYGYPRGKLSSCGWQDLAWWGWHDRTDSVHYNLPSGSVGFLNHGSRADHVLDFTMFSVGAGSRTISDVYPWRNMADHVYRYC